MTWMKSMGNGDDGDTVDATVFAIAIAIVVVMVVLA